MVGRGQGVGDEGELSGVPSECNANHPRPTTQLIASELLCTTASDPLEMTKWVKLGRAGHRLP